MQAYECTDKIHVVHMVAIAHTMQNEQKTARK